MPTHPPAALVRPLLAMAIFAGFASAQTPAASQEQVLYFQSSATAQSAQEIAIAVRTLSTTAQISFDEAQKAVSVRGTADQVAVAAWVFHQLDAPPGGGLPSPASLVAPGAADDVVRVFYPANIKTPQGLQELAIAIRTITDIQRMMACNGPGAVALRGTAAQAALAEWLLNALDKPDGWQLPAGQGQNPVAYQYSDDSNPTDGDAFVRVFYLPPATTPPELQAITRQIRTASSCRRIMGVTTHHVLALRGTASQITTAEQLVAARYPPPSKP